MNSMLQSQDQLISIRDLTNQFPMDANELKNCYLFNGHGLARRSSYLPHLLWIVYRVTVERMGWLRAGGVAELAWKAEEGQLGQM
jgi:hypothetical protein